MSSRLPCEFDWTNPTNSVHSIKALWEKGHCAHIAFFDTSPEDEYEALLFTSPSCHHHEGQWNSDCGRTGPKICQLIVFPKKKAIRRFPDPLVISCRVESYETDVLTFDLDAIPNAVLAPFSVKGGLGRKSVAEKRVSYETVSSLSFRQANAGYTAEVSKWRVRQPDLQGSFIVAVSAVNSASANELDPVEMPETFSSLSKAEVQKWTLTLLEMIRRRNIPIPFDMRLFINKQVKTMATEAELLRYCFITKGEFLNELMALRKGNVAPSNEQARSQTEVFGRNSLQKLFGISKGSMSASQVFRFVTDCLLPVLEKSSTGKKIGIEIADEQKANQLLNEKKREREVLRSELEKIKNSIDEETYLRFDSMIENELFETSLIWQKFQGMNQAWEDDSSE